MRAGLHRQAYEFTSNGIVTQGETMDILVRFEKRKVYCKERISTKLITKNVDGNIENSETKIVRSENWIPLPKNERLKYILDAYPQAAQISYNLPKENLNSEKASSLSN